MVCLRLTVALHDLEELDDDLGGWSDHDLALAGLLGVVDGIERIVEDGSLDHVGGCMRFSGRDVRREVSAAVLLAFKSHRERKECPPVRDRKSSEARSRQALRCHCESSR